MTEKKRPRSRRTVSKTVIRSTRGWFEIDWREIWDYRDLLGMMVHREWLTQYHQTLLGVAWYLFYPLMATITFTVIFGWGIRVPTDSIPPLLFYLSGMVLWTYFAQTFSGVSASLFNSAHLFGKMYFPRVIVPFSIMISNLMTLGVQTVIFCAFYLFFKFCTPSGALIHPGCLIWTLPFFFFQAGLLALGSGLWIVALTVRYRDLQHTVGFILQFWMYITPIIYPVSVLSKQWQRVLFINPLAPLVEWMRHVLFGTGFFEPASLAISLAVTVAVLVSGFFAFHRAEPVFADYL